MLAHFEARELKLDPEPARAADLVEGGVYFSVSYADPDRWVPVLESYVFVGRSPTSSDSSPLYFRRMDPVRRRAHGEPSTEDDFGDLHLEAEAGLRFFEFEQALEELMLCSLRRRGVSGHRPVDSGSVLTDRTICFEARDLKPFAEPVKASELEEGSVYFSVFFLDDGCLIPGLEPYVFVGRNLDAEEAGLYFQDIGSFKQGIRYGMATGGSTPAILVIDTDDIINHFDYEEALETLMMCSLRRQGQF